MPIIYAKQLFLLHFDEYIRLIKQSGKPYRSELSTFVLSYGLLLLLIFLQEAIGLLVAQLLGFGDILYTFCPLIVFHLSHAQEQVSIGIIL